MSKLGGRKSGKWYESSKYYFSKSAVADFRKSGNFGGDFYKHMSVSLQWLISENLQTWGELCCTHCHRNIIYHSGYQLLNVSMIPTALNEVVLVTYL